MIILLLLATFAKNQRNVPRRKTEKQNKKKEGKRMDAYVKKKAHVRPTRKKAKEKR